MEGRIPRKQKSPLQSNTANRPASGLDAEGLCLYVGPPPLGGGRSQNDKNSSLTQEKRRGSYSGRGRDVSSSKRRSTTEASIRRRNALLTKPPSSSLAPQTPPASPSKKRNSLNNILATVEGKQNLPPPVASPTTPPLRSPTTSPQPCKPLRTTTAASLNESRHNEKRKASMSPSASSPAPPKRTRRCVPDAAAAPSGRRRLSGNHAKPHNLPHGTAKAPPSTTSRTTARNSVSRTPPWMPTSPKQHGHLSRNPIVTPGARRESLGHHTDKNDKHTFHLKQATTSPTSRRPSKKIESPSNQDAIEKRIGRSQNALHKNNNPRRNTDTASKSRKMKSPPTKKKRPPHNNEKHTATRTTNGNSKKRAEEPKALEKQIDEIIEKEIRKKLIEEMVKKQIAKRQIEALRKQREPRPKRPKTSRQPEMAKMDTTTTREETVTASRGEMLRSREIQEEEPPPLPEPVPEIQKRSSSNETPDKRPIEELEVSKSEEAPCVPLENREEEKEEEIQVVPYYDLTQETKEELSSETSEAQNEPEDAETEEITNLPSPKKREEASPGRHRSTEESLQEEQDALEPKKAPSSESDVYSRMLQDILNVIEVCLDENDGSFKLDPSVLVKKRRRFWKNEAGLSKEEFQEMWTNVRKEVQSRHSDLFANEPQPKSDHSAVEVKQEAKEDTAENNSPVEPMAVAPEEESWSLRVASNKDHFEKEHDCQPSRPRMAIKQEKLLEEVNDTEKQGQEAEATTTHFDEEEMSVDSCSDNEETNDPTIIDLRRPHISKKALAVGSRVTLRTHSRLYVTLRVEHVERIV